ncbi:VWD domain-containing protein [Plantactinospora mayteni]|nr:VWD domain-containing protein [Plantactinospora mayteni]
MTLTRDGKPVGSAGFALVTFGEGYAAALSADSRELATGATLDFELVTESGSAGPAFETMAATADGAAVAARWPVHEPGRYLLRATYQMPGTTGECAGPSDPAEAAFTIGSAESGGWRRLVVLVTVGMLLLLAVAGTAWVLARRRTRTGAGAAIVILLVGAALVSLGQARPARASIEIDDRGDPANLGFVEAVQGCLNDFRVTLGDQVGVMEILDKPGFRVIIRPNRSNVSEATHYYGYTNVDWNPKQNGAYSQDPKVALDKCASLYHELVHAVDNAADEVDLTRCGIGSDGKPTNRGPAIAEVRAVRAENYYRAAKGLPLRHNYSGLPLPPGRHPGLQQVREDCKKPADPPTRTGRPGDNQRNGNDNPDGAGGPPGGDGDPPAADGAPRDGAGNPPHPGGDNPPNGNGGPRNEGGTAPNGGTDLPQEGGDASGTPTTDLEPPGGSNGDPHLVTFDQRWYDFQAVGEFLLAKSDDVEIHVRQAAVPNSQDMSLNSAFGLRVGASRLTFALYDGRPEIRLDGVETDFTDARTALPGGGTVTTSADDGYDVVWPDGTRANVAFIGWWGMRILLHPAPRHKGKFIGLLGNQDGDPANDLAVRNGTTLPAQPSHEQLYGEFADSWRISQDTSLLDYPAGTDTDTYTNRDFPAKTLPADQANVAQHEAARRICAALGVVDAVAQGGCVTDLAFTGQPAFAISTAATVRRIAGAAPGRTEPGGNPTDGVPPQRAGPGGTLRDGSVVTGSIATAGAVQTYRLEVGEATVLRLVDVTGETGRSGAGSLRITTDGPGASTAPGFTVTSTYQYSLLPGAAYTLSVDRTGGDTGDYGFRLVTAKERRIDSTLGTTTGSLDVPGRVDLHAFEAAQSGRLRLSEANGCEFTVGVLDDTPAPHLYTPHNLCWGTELATLERGKRYLLVVWSETAGTGSYSFRATVTN